MQKCDGYAPVPVLAAGSLRHSLAASGPSREGAQDPARTHETVNHALCSDCACRLRPRLRKRTPHTRHTSVQALYTLLRLYIVCDRIRVTNYHAVSREENAA